MESVISINSVVPTFKQTSDPIEEVFQMQIDDTIETDLHSDPLDVYSRQVLYDEDFQDTVYGTDGEFNTLFYDIDQSSDNEASDQQITDQASISKSVISTFVCTQQNTQSVCLAQVNGKVKRMWVKTLFKSDPKINPNFALDMPTYTKTTNIHSFHPTVIHATYLYSDSDLDTQFQLRFDGTVTASTLTGLPLHTLFDTGCHKTLLSKKVFYQNIKHFQNYYDIPFLEKNTLLLSEMDNKYMHIK